MDLYQLDKRHKKRWSIAFALMFAALLMVSIFSLTVGEVLIWPFAPDSDLERMLVTELRLPRLIAAIAVGAALAVSGASLQVLLGNPLAEPGILGISGGASLSLAAVIFFLPTFPSVEVLMLAAMCGAMLFTLILVVLATRKRLSTTRLLLVGVALGILTGAGVTWGFYFSDDLNLRLLMYWLMGNLGGVSWLQLSVIVLMLPVIGWLCTKGKQLDTLMMGEIYAKQLGLNVDRLRWQLIIVVSLLVGASVALGGVIGFIGLVIPHLIRLCVGAQNQYLLPLSAVFGACLLVFSDTLSRIILSSAELPVGVVTTSIGAPVFIWLLLKSHD
ncbi:vitamin B12 ABC transporter permease BtuC [Aliivibrio kagoshimensis]|uniref:vitamin B12 ABC transporter permease BtuC n=1 Tax=Aliivibrio kagoshimensis TaxID=2910230 RepID=UPI003D0DA778